ncbi:MAG: hypothetical protein DDT19_02151 [Syntrophomonadaceae bacterium]|nr:hypothetical protein [Bacillota bacterium]
MKETYLYKKLSDKRVQCLNCAHRCIILPGKRGICGVRENITGKLYALNYGKAIACHIDPIEKKPFFHFLPGSYSLSIATVGCNFRCLNCFISSTKVITNRGLMSIKEIFNFGKNSQYRVDGSEKRKVEDLHAITHKGHYKKIINAFRHPFKDEILVIKPRYTPPIKCTKSHKFLVTQDPLRGKLEKIRADQLSKDYYLVIPKNYPFSIPNIELNIKDILSSHIPPFLKKNTKINIKIAKEILKLSKQGETSRNLALKYHFHPSYIRTLRSKFRKKGISSYLFWHENQLTEKRNTLVYKYEKKLGISKNIKLDEHLARLLGYYCAEGCVSKLKNRPNSYQLIFCFGHREKQRVTEVKNLIEEIFNIKPKIVQQRTITRINIGKSSLAIFFKILCGSRAKNKKVPEVLNQTTKNVVKAFLDGFIAGDGSIQKGEISIGTISKELAFGIYWLWLKMGFLPSFYEWKPSSTTIIEKRKVNQLPYYYVKLKAQKFRKSFLNNDLIVSSKSTPLFKENDLYYFVPIFKISKRRYSGYVYNIEVEEDHSYLANFISVGNCQNWDISQGFKNRKEIPGEDLLPEEIVKIALKNKLPSISYTYTEPVIFLEYALDTMKLAKKKNLKNTFVSNGFMSKESAKLVIPYLDAINIDVKSFSEEFYREVCGARLQPVLDTAKLMKKSGVWTEITTLVIPTLSDSEKMFKDIAGFIKKELGIETPWHISQFSGLISWKLQHLPETSVETLEMAYKIGKEAGLKYVYTGNVPGLPSEDTFCPKCKALCIDRTNYIINRYDKNGKCPRCGASLDIVN